MNAQVRQVLERLDARPAVAAYIQAARDLRGVSDTLHRLRVALLATFTIDQLAAYVTVEAARAGFAAETYIGPFNSARQELLDPQSGCARFQPDAVFLFQLLQDVCPPLTNRFLALDPGGRETLMHDVVADLASAARAFREHSTAPLVVGNFCRPLYPPLGILEPMASESLTKSIGELNAALVEELRHIPGIHVLDFDRVCADVGYMHAFDERMWHLGRAPLAQPVLPVLARRQTVFLQALAGAPRKCLVLDLDNTLWGGVVGETGIAGIGLGQTYPGSAFVAFQRRLLELHQRGILLAINSKNNPADVDEVFRAHPDMVLKREHFASVRVNWQDKPSNMREIARELNIGLDSLVFFDDNPAERSLMRLLLPEVLTLEVPADPTGYIRTLADVAPFDRLSFTAEDRRRGAMYQEQAQRESLRAGAATLQDFLAGLQMTVRIRPVDRFTAPRVLDLLQKTNQFNLTTRRHAAPQLERFMTDPHSAAFTLQVLDRFGDEGIVGVAIVLRQGRAAFIETLLMSCRVIGRTVETAFLSFLADWARQQDLETLVGEFVPTAKNAPAADFYERHGFTPLGDGRWVVRLDSVPFAWPDYIVRDGSIAVSDMKR